MLGERAKLRFENAMDKKLARDTKEESWSQWLAPTNQAVYGDSSSGYTGGKSPERPRTTFVSRFTSMRCVAGFAKTSSSTQKESKGL